MDSINLVAIWMETMAITIRKDTFSSILEAAKLPLVPAGV